MKIVAIKNNLRDGVSIVEKISGENLNLPILKNIFLETLENKIKLTTTNLEIAISSYVPCKTIEGGKATVPASATHSILNSLQDERINLEWRGGKINIKTDNYEASLQGASPEDFPITPKLKNQSNHIEVKGDVIRAAFIKVLIAAQFSELRPELSGVFLNFSPEEIKIAATDSFRLAEKTIHPNQFNSNHKESFKILIPLRAVQEAVRIFKNEDIIKILNDENQILLKTEQVELLSRLIDGNFPEYQAIIPNKFIAEAALNLQEFLSALKLVGVFGSKNSEVEFKSKDGSKFLEISSADQTIGENKYLIPAKTTGKFNGIVFNWRHVIDAVKTIEGDEIFFGVNGENEPAELKSATDPSYIYILKPITSV